MKLYVFLLLAAISNRVIAVDSNQYDVTFTEEKNFV